MTIACIAVISKENAPVLLRVYEEGADETKFHYICYGAIDLFEEREVARGRNADMFLGQLFPVEGYDVLGYVTNTGVRFALVVGAQSQHAPDPPLVKAFFKKLQALYIDCVSNPFYKPGQPIVSASLDRDLLALVRLWNTDALQPR
mmetsp:Transcript_13202/g.32052  ORF Transcript_13202/g.32052 Transcript_13202/m.32052 type:complete len:146 (+) Transcript_13202:259-696(+)|eukprot:CAMPEP_0180133942 /NCGR_PEP_ID=MMETSP0986-20121125/9839_1 /TAXON_ID=697907 /ORGANISM="non described non described, Strain CCMP2293" /LENGTH=145 /DNA_ID=CAMNT_0022074153 /DNA_START=259 /DNA_END=696 /DNA_ORIENTATION=+